MSDPIVIVDGIDQRAVWNAGERQAGTTWDEIRPDHRGRYMFAVDFLSGYLSSEPRELDILDAACGVGYGTRHLRDALATSRIVGVDRDAAAIHWGAAHFVHPAMDGADLLQADVCALPFWDARFDVVVSFETLEHLDAVAALREFRRVLKPGGLLFCSTPNEERLPWTADFQHHLRHYTPAEFKQLLETAGFEIIYRGSNVDRHSEEIATGWEGLFNLAVCRRR